jgi:glycosyltransferase involved in cell wall biosynthesis
MKLITVFTPTYNRAFCLDNLYSSLKNQTSSDFLWLIIDDGSSDNTKQLVQEWIDEKKIEIQYLYKPNGGMHTGHNMAYKNINTLLNVCIDSDDFMPIDAIEIIKKTWDNNQDKNIAGIIGNDSDLKGNILGSSIPNEIKFSNLYELYHKYGLSGDKKIVLRTEIVKQFPLYPEYEDEKIVPLGTLYFLIDQHYKFICTNHVLCVVEYLPGGSSNTIIKQYKQSPRGFAYHRKLRIDLSKSYLEKFKHSVQLVSSSIFAKDFSLLFKTNYSLLVVPSIPFGILFHIYINFFIKFKHNENSSSNK